MKKHVKSTDPRKKQITAALKAKVGCNKVTNVYEIDNISFCGDCLRGNRTGYQNLGTFYVSKEEVGL